MEDELLAKIRARCEWRRRVHVALRAPEDSVWHQLALDNAALLAEVDRLRAASVMLAAEGDFDQSSDEVRALAHTLLYPPNPDANREVR